MDPVKIVLLAAAVIISLVLIQALRTGTLITHKGPELKRADRPGTFWTMFGSYTAILACTIWGLFMW